MTLWSSSWVGLDAPVWLASAKPWMLQGFMGGGPGNWGVVQHRCEEGGQTGCILSGPAILFCQHRTKIPVPKERRGDRWKLSLVWPHNQTNHTILVLGYKGSSNNRNRFCKLQVHYESCSWAPTMVWGAGCVSALHVCWRSPERIVRREQCVEGWAPEAQWCVLCGLCMCEW